MIAPHLEEMSKTMDDVVILKVDVDDCEDIAAQYNVYNLLFVLTINFNIYFRSLPCPPSSSSSPRPRWPT